MSQLSGVRAVAFGMMAIVLGHAPVGAVMVDTWSRLSANKAVAKQVDALISQRPHDHEFANDYAAVVELGRPAFEPLMGVAADKAVPFRGRWVALMAASEILNANPTISDQSATQAAYDRTIELLLKEPFAMMRAAAVKALGKTKDPRWLSAIHFALQDRTVVVRDEAIRSIAEIRQPESAAVLKRAFQDQKNFIRGQGLFLRTRILQAIAMIERDAASDFLAKALEDSDPSVVAEAARLLGEVKPQLGLSTVAEWQAWSEKKTDPAGLQPVNP